MPFGSMSVATYIHVYLVSLADFCTLICLPHQLMSNLRTETKSYSYLSLRSSVEVIVKESLILAAELTNRIVTYFLSVHSLQ